MAVSCEMSLFKLLIPPHVYLPQLLLSSGKSFQTLLLSKERKRHVIVYVSDRRDNKPASSLTVIDG